MRRRALGLLAGGVRADTRTGRVIGIADGDSLKLLVAGNRQVKVYMAGIDAPERDQPFGRRSRQSLAELAFKSVGDGVRTDGF